MLLLAPFFGERVAPVGRMKRAVPVFWSAVTTAFFVNLGRRYFVTASTITSSSSNGFMELGQSSSFMTIAVSSCFIGSLKVVLGVYFILGNALVGAAFYFSPPSTPPGTRMGQSGH